jgi:microcystin-dependent protein
MSKPIPVEIQASLDELRTLIHDSTPTGTVILFAGNVIPKGWLPCDGAEHSNEKYQLLAKCIRLLYGAPSKPNYFKVPDLTNRVPVGPDKNYPVGTTFGDKDLKISSNHLPEHLHNITGSFHPNGAKEFGHHANHNAADVQPGHGIGTWFDYGPSTTGGQPNNDSQIPFDLYQPSLAMMYIIKI